jgi:hypothetical protein
MRRTLSNAPVLATAVVAVLAVATLAVVTGCSGKGLITSPEQPSPSFTGTSYYQSGKELFFGIDVRAARIGGPRTMLPLYLTIVRLEGDAPIYFGRESFVLELPDRSRVPLADYDEFSHDYDRSRADLRAVGTFIDALAGKFPEPPYSWLPLDFFPPRGSGTFPRETIDLRAQQLTHGFVYFRLPEEPPLDARYKLLVTPQRSETTFVIDFPPFRKDDKKP